MVHMHKMLVWSKAVKIFGALIMVRLIKKETNSDKLRIRNNNSFFWKNERIKIHKLHEIAERTGSKHLKKEL